MKSVATSHGILIGIAESSDIQQLEFAMWFGREKIGQRFIATKGQRKMSLKSDDVLEQYVRITGDIWELRARQWLSEFLEILEKELVKDNSSEGK